MTSYTKYGDEWEREVMRNDKHAIVDMLRRVAINSDAELAAKAAEIERLQKTVVYFADMAIGDEPSFGAKRILNACRAALKEIK